MKPPGFPWIIDKAEKGDFRQDRENPRGAILIGLKLHSDSVNGASGEKSIVFITVATFTRWLRFCISF
jgi:hypothetical protein